MRHRAPDRPVRGPPADQPHVRSRSRRPQPTRVANASPVAGALPSPGPAQAAYASGAEAGAAPAPIKILPAQPGIDLSQIEGQVRESSVKKIGEVVNAHPEEALAIIRTWLHQPV